MRPFRVLTFVALCFSQGCNETAFVLSCQLLQPSFVFAVFECPYVIPTKINYGFVSDLVPIGDTIKQPYHPQYVYLYIVGLALPENKLFCH